MLTLTLTLTPTLTLTLTLALTLALTLPLPLPRSPGQHPVERQLVERQLLHVEEHKWRVAEQRHELLAKLEQAMALQAEQTDRAQRAVQAERR